MCFQRRRTIVLAGFRPFFLLSQAFPEGCYKFRKGEMVFHLSIRVLFCRLNIYFSVCLKVLTSLKRESLIFFFENFSILSTLHLENTVCGPYVRGQPRQQSHVVSFWLLFQRPKKPPPPSAPVIKQGAGKVPFCSINTVCVILCVYLQCPW